MPDRIYTYQFINTTNGIYTIPAPYIENSNILSVDRDGIGVLSSNGSDDDVVTSMIYQYQHMSINNGISEPLDTYLIKYFETGTTIKSSTITIGSVGITGHIYKLYIDGTYISYTLGLFEPTENVIDSFVNNINFGNFGFSITATKIDTHSLIVTYPEGRVIDVLHIWDQKYRFQSGAYVKIVGKFYSIYNTLSYAWYPNYSLPNSSYDISTLYQTPFGIMPFLAYPNYTLVNYKEETAGNALFTGIESQIPTIPGTYRYDIGNQTLTFAEPLNEGEYIKVLYK